MLLVSQVGSVASAILMKRSRPELFMKYVFGIAGASLAVPFLFHITPAGESGPAFPLV